jgi:hypothetical protein
MDVYFLESTCQILNMLGNNRGLQTACFVFSCSIESTHVAYCLDQEGSF